MRLNKAYPRKKWMVTALATTAAVLFGVFMNITSLAASTGKITGNGVNVRAEASTSSEAVGTLQKNDTITINEIFDPFHFCYSFMLNISL